MVESQPAFGGKLAGQAVAGYLMAQDKVPRQRRAGIRGRWVHSGRPRNGLDHFRPRRPLCVSGKFTLLKTLAVSDSLRLLRLRTKLPNHANEERQHYAKSTKHSRGQANCEYPKGIWMHGV